jgi:hypothetical protein
MTAAGRPFRPGAGVPFSRQLLHNIRAVRPCQHFFALPAKTFLPCRRKILLSCRRKAFDPANILPCRRNFFHRHGSTDPFTGNFRAPHAAHPAAHPAKTLAGAFAKPGCIRRPFPDASSGSSSQSILRVNRSSFPPPHQPLFCLRPSG